MQAYFPDFKIDESFKQFSICVHPVGLFTLPQVSKPGLIMRF